MKLSARLLALVLFASLAACSSVPYKNIDRFPNIVGGDKVRADDILVKKVVLILGTTQMGGRGYCTGVMIDKDVVLTAAHCINSAIKKYYVIPHIDMSPESGFDRVTHSIPVTNWILHEEYLDDGNKHFNDVALLKLEKAVPEDYVPVPLYDGKAKLSEQEVTLAGYGRTSETSIDASYLRSTTKSLKNVLVNYKGEKGAMYLTEGEIRGACEGDSGGPVFYKVNGEYQLAGVISTTFGPDAMTYCHGIVKAMYVPDYIPWIEKNKPRLNH
ncbi:S1 family peptidase [Bdellovibrio sp. HCB185ZH]|uniref:S1 family peptidase n=1 Tax=Bdellovibrio sp. HCB185ZH TaxID=3394235 RepID=UPI0039A70A93